jgi:hypothetical protein
MCIIKEVKKQIPYKLSVGEFARFNFLAIQAGATGL